MALRKLIVHTLLVVNNVQGIFQFASLVSLNFVFNIPTSKCSMLIISFSPRQHFVKPSPRLHWHGSIVRQKMDRITTKHTGVPSGWGHDFSTPMDPNLTDFYKISHLEKRFLPDSSEPSFWDFSLFYISVPDDICFFLICACGLPNSCPHHPLGHCSGA